jgi:hypothetical protein
MDLPNRLAAGLGQSPKKVQAVHILDEDVLLADATIHHMADLPGASLEPRRSTSDRRSEVLRGGSGEAAALSAGTGEWVGSGCGATGWPFWGANLSQRCQPNAANRQGSKAQRRSLKPPSPRECRRLNDESSRSTKATLRPPSGYPQAILRPSGSQLVGTRKPPLGYPEATLKRPHSLPKASPKST